MRRAETTTDGGELNVKTSIKDNLKYWCYEVDTVFENHTIELAKMYRDYIVGKEVVDLGSGDGAANKGFKGLTITAVDINQDKLDKNTAQHKICQDFITYLEGVDAIPNLFMCHTLEHFIEPEKVLNLLNKKVTKSIFIAVPARDSPSSVHHVAFDSVDELILPDFETKLAIERPYADLYEYIYVGVKK